MSKDTELLISNLLNKMGKLTKPAKRLVIPISGGSDSALIFALLNKVCPEKTIGHYIGSKPLRESDWFNKTGSVITVALPTEHSMNAEPQRWAVMLTYALLNNAWLVGSRNRTEDVLGTYSLASRVATYLPLTKIWKTDVMAMCDILDIPKAITDSSRQADPDCGRPQEMAEIPLELIDNYLKFLEGLIHTTSITEEQKQYLQSIMGANKFKRSLPLKH